MKVLFVIDELGFADHIAIAYLSAMAKQLNHSTYLCVLEDQHFLEQVDEIKPDVIAYSANVMGFERIVASHKQARQRHDFVAILGGPQATFSPETFADSQMDAYCVGEGEYAFRDFLTRIENGEPYEDVRTSSPAKRAIPSGRSSEIWANCLWPTATL